MNLAALHEPAPTLPCQALEVYGSTARKWMGAQEQGACHSMTSELCITHMIFSHGCKLAKTMLSGCPWELGGLGTLQVGQGLVRPHCAWCSPPKLTGAMAVM